MGSVYRDQQVRKAIVDERRNHLFNLAAKFTRADRRSMPRRCRRMLDLTSHQLACVGPDELDQAEKLLNEYETHLDLLRLCREYAHSEHRDNAQPRARDRLRWVATFAVVVVLLTAGYVVMLHSISASFAAALAD